MGKDTVFSLPCTDLKAEGKSDMFAKLYDWAEERGTQKGKYFFQNFYKPRRKPWFHKLKINRKGMVSVGRLRAGHTSLLESL